MGFQKVASDSSSMCRLREKPFMEELERLKKEWGVGENGSDSTTISSSKLSSEDDLHVDQALSAVEVDRKFPQVATLAMAIWIILLILVFVLSPVDSFERLQGLEQQVPATAAIVLAAVMVMYCLPFLRILWRGKKRPSGIIFSAMVVVTCAISTNILLALFPTPVVIDPVTHARVFLVRWCEWIPLAGLMTFMSEAVDIPKKKGGFRMAYQHSLIQALSTFCGIVFPYCENVYVWGAVMIVSMVTYLPIFPLVELKRQRLLKTPRGVTFLEREIHDRRFFAYHLLRICSIVWTVLVAFYFANWFLHRGLSQNHKLRNPVNAIAFDTIFDVFAKGFYLRVIVEVHHNVFDIDSRMRRQLNELRSLMAIVWDSSSDVIFVSVKDENGKASTLFSPSFTQLVESTPPPNVMIAGDGALGVMLETETKLQEEEEYDNNVFKIVSFIDNNNDRIDSKPITLGGGPIMSPSKAQWIESGHFSSTDDNLVIAPINITSRLVSEAVNFVNASWNRLANNLKEKTSVLLLHEFTRLDGQTCFCEIKVSRRASESLVALVRDVSERYKRFNAEQAAHQEALNRQKDAQTVNRFTRHEIKNGLLSGMELCERLLDSFHEVGTKVERRLGESYKEDHLLGSEMAKMGGMIGQVDRCLHQVLDTALAEATARDVVHECYEPSPKKTDIQELFKDSHLGVATDKRFPLEFPKGPIPPLMIDPMMLRYIHRNAMSNASKYGRPGGKIITRVRYDEGKQKLRVEVINEPGYGHADLVSRSEEEVNALVFQQGTRLHIDLGKGDCNLSSGDGAWIMQKCAKNLGGFCRIKFKRDKTVFIYEGPAEVCSATEDHDDFDIPENTWGVGIDDSSLQRKVLLRIFNEIGIKKTRRKVMGENPREVKEGLGQMIMDILDRDSFNKVLVLVDENLDFEIPGGGRILLSGSRKMQNILQSLPPEKRDRLLVLVRSANDSANDIALYQERCHGFMPKNANKRDLALEVITPLWFARFGRNEPDPEDEDESEGRLVEGEELLTKQDLRVAVSCVDELLRGRSFRDVPWQHLWSVLHSLKGDIMVSDNQYLLWAYNAIDSMRGHQAPADFNERWSAIRQSIEAAMADCT